MNDHRLTIRIVHMFDNIFCLIFVYFYLKIRSRNNLQRAKLYQNILIFMCHSIYSASYGPEKNISHLSTPKTLRWHLVV